MQEKRHSPFRPAALVVRFISPAARRNPPPCRRASARTGERAAIHRRSEIDRPCGLGKPREGHAMRETASTTSVATPAQDDTLTLVPRDRRGALTGVATDLR